MATVAAYRTDLKCGECILGNYTFCVRGTEGMIVGSTPPETYCCANAANCTMAKNSSWACSSSYNNSVDKYRVCPYYPGQCGSSANLNLSGVGDSSCIRIKGLQQGNACFYNVKSRCGVPDFQLNDT
jgi:hypothetical protein